MIPSTTISGCALIFKLLIPFRLILAPAFGEPVRDTTFNPLVDVCKIVSILEAAVR